MDCSPWGDWVASYSIKWWWKKQLPIYEIYNYIQNMTFQSNIDITWLDWYCSYNQSKFILNQGELPYSKLSIKNPKINLTEGRDKVTAKWSHIENDH